MKPKYTVVPASELFATEIGISGVPLPTNGPGRKNPFIKYIFLGGVIIGAFALAYHLHKQAVPKINRRENENGTNKK